MTPQGTQEIFRHTNLPNESAEYLSKREELRLAEIELMRQRERAADLRRDLPKGATIQDYVFDEGPRDLQAGDTPTRAVRLSELFTGPNRSLVIYHFMYGKKQTKPCPMCTMWIDGLNGVAHHLAQNLDFAIVAAADLPTLRKYARNRGWDRLRLLSAGTNTFKYDLGSEDREGEQDSTISVFTRDHDGTLRHFYSAHPSMAHDIQQRGIDLLTPVYNVLDLTPQGRGDWYAGLGYGARIDAAKSPASSIVWFEIPADNVERAKNFYNALFGWKIEKFPGVADYWHIDTGGADASPDGGLMKRVHAGQPITNYIAVSSVDESATRVEDLGGSICKTKTAVPGMGYFIICQDPENNMFALWEANQTAK